MFEFTSFRKFGEIGLYDAKAVYPFLGSYFALSRLGICFSSQKSQSIIYSQLTFYVTYYIIRIQAYMPLRGLVSPATTRSFPARFTCPCDICQHYALMVRPGPCRTHRFFNLLEPP